MEGHTFTAWPDSLVGCFGGKRGDRYTNDLWHVRVSMESGNNRAVWCKAEGASRPPAPRAYHTATLWRKRFMIVVGGVGEAASGEFDGEAETGRESVFWMYERGNGWRLQTTQGDAPQRRCHHATALDAQNDSMYLYGGYPVGPESDRLLATEEGTSTPKHPGFFDVFELRLGGPTPMWRQVQSHNAPPMMWGHVAALYSTNLIIHAGVDVVDGQESKTVCVWHTQRHEWRWVDFTTAPDPRALHSGAVLPGTDRVYIFGGFGSVNSVKRNDTWTFSCESGQWSPVPSTGPFVIAPRSGHAGCIISSPRKLLVIHGGVGASGSILSDTHALDFESGAWAPLKPEETTDPLALSAAQLDTASAQDSIPAAPSFVGEQVESVSSQPSLRPAHPPMGSTESLVRGARPSGPSGPILPPFTPPVGRGSAANLTHSSLGALEPPGTGVAYNQASFGTEARSVASGGTSLDSMNLIVPHGASRGERPPPVPPARGPGVELRLARTLDHDFLQRTISAHLAHPKEKVVLDVAWAGDHLRCRVQLLPRDQYSQNGYELAEELLRRCLRRGDALREALAGLMEALPIGIGAEAVRPPSHPAHPTLHDTASHASRSQTPTKNGLPIQVSNYPLELDQVVPWSDEVRHIQTYHPPKPPREESPAAAAAAGGAVTQACQTKQDPEDPELSAEAAIIAAQKHQIEQLQHRIREAERAKPPPSSVTGYLYIPDDTEVGDAPCLSASTPRGPDVMLTKTTLADLLPHSGPARTPLHRLGVKGLSDGARKHVTRSNIAATAERRAATEGPGLSFVDPSLLPTVAEGLSDAPRQRPPPGQAIALPRAPPKRQLLASTVKTGKSPSLKSIIDGQASMLSITHLAGSDARPPLP